MTDTTKNKNAGLISLAVHILEDRRQAILNFFSEQLSMSQQHARELIEELAEIETTLEKE